MQRDADEVRQFLTRVRRRLALLSSVEGAAAGLALAVVVAAARPLPGDPRSIISAAILILAGVAARIIWSRHTRGRAAYAVEQRAPQCRNLVITAEELQSAGHDEYIVSLVERQAARLVQTLDVRALFPARTPLAVLLLATLVWLAVVLRPAALSTPTHRRTTGSSTANAAIERVDVLIIPPAYTGRAPQSVRDPSRIEALAGSVLRFKVAARAARLVSETIVRLDTVAATEGTFTVDVAADADGYVALAPIGVNGQSGTRRLVGLSVLPDAPPRVRITAPGRDLLLRDPKQTIVVTIDAQDDIGLGALRLKYTKVSGSGERFTFRDGEIPLAVTRSSDRAWTAKASLNLASLGLDAGDMVVYHAAATDRRPGAVESESDSYIAEIMAPGGNAAAGFAIDPEQERYAVSQQMVILKTERLLARRPSIPADTLSATAQEIAVEQRKVRAEFVFMLGGELADAPDPTGSITDLNEEAEANGEGDLAAGRSANAGHIALLRAIRAMSRASTALTVAAVDSALVQEKAALTELERAFSRTRIILRALTQRERLDPSRRLSGALNEAASDARPTTDAQLDPRTVALRRALLGIATLSGELTDTQTAPRASALAESVLQADPSAAALQHVADLVASAAGALDGTTAGVSRARASLDRAATELSAVLRSELLAAPRQPDDLRLRRMNGELTDALRRAASPP